jgi:ADP-heptose:LPS heptosyltransferase
MENSTGRETPERFLVISTTAIGDTLMGTPALRALRESFPNSTIEVLTHAKRKELLWGNPHVDRIIAYRNNSLYRKYLSWKFRNRFYDHVLIFHANEDVLGIFGALHYGDCFSRQNIEDPSKRIYRLRDLPPHSIQRRLAMIERVGGKSSEDYRYTFLLPEAANRRAADLLARWGIDSADLLVGFQLGSNDRFKCWPVESFVEVARHLHLHYGTKIYLNASPKEKNMVKEFLRRFGEKDVFFHLGTRIGQSAALIRACSLFISPDTGPMHMAIGLQVPLIALFCPTDCRETGPLGYEKAMVIQKPLICNPCTTRRCRNNDCMRQITVEEVCAAADKILARSPQQMEDLPD